MTPRGIQVAKTTPFRAVVEELQNKKRFCAVVLDNRKVVGIFTERDALSRGLLKQVAPETPIEQLMTPQPEKIKRDDSLAKAIGQMHQGNHRHLPVVDEEDNFLGLVSVRDVIFYLSENYPYEVFNQPPDLHQVSETPEGA